MRRMRIVLYLWVSFAPMLLFAQFSDDFTDGDFTANPVWSGNDTKFEIDGTGKLHLNAPAITDHVYLSTPSQALEEAVWEFYVEIGANPSSTNFTSIYLVSDQADFSGALNGYFVKVGGTPDEVSLYRQDENSATKIIDGLDGRVNVSTVTLRVKVTRDVSGNWELFSDNTGGTSYISEGAVTDDTYLQSTYFGVYCEYTSTRSDKFYFDDFVVTGNLFTDKAPPEVLSLEVLAADSLRLQFSEPLAIGSAENNAHYEVEGILPNMAVLQDSNRVLLTFAAPFANGSTHTLTIAHVTDTSGNAMPPTDREFIYFEAVPAIYRDIVINEIFPDPNPQVDSLPADADAEFIELYNNSEHPFDLAGWIMNNAALPAFLLFPGQYVIICKNTYYADFAVYGDAIGLTTWPVLSNSGGTILLKDPEGTTIDSLIYTSGQIAGGYSLEQIHPNPPCLTADNFTLSTHPNGATPGVQNAVFDDAPDTMPPHLLSVTVDSVNRLSLFFDEKLEETSREEMDNYVITGGMEVGALQAEDQQVSLTLTADLQQGQTYTVSVSGITDCSGNAVANNPLSFLYDVQPPVIAKIIVVDTSTIEVIWDEVITKTLAEKEENYTVNQNINPLSAKLNADDSLKMTLIFGKAFGEGITHSLYAVQISDTLDNVIPDSIPAAFAFTYLNQVDSVVVVDSNLLEVYFSGPVSEETAENIKNYEVDGNVGHPGVAVLSEDKRRIILIFGQNFTGNKEHTLMISHILSTSGSFLSTPVQRFIHDTQAPKITDITVLTANSLIVSFDEKINRSSAEQPDNYEVADLGNPIAAQLQEEGVSVLLKFSENFTPELEHLLTVMGIEDVEGNVATGIQTGTFVFDPLSPSIEQLIFVSPRQIRLIFSEPLDPGSAKNIDFYQIDQNIGRPDTVVLSPINPAWVDLKFGNSFQDDLTYTLTVQNLQDLRGNVMEKLLTLPFSNQFPSLVEVISWSATEVHIRFSKNVSKETAENPDHYSLNKVFRPESATLNTDDPAEVKLVFAEKFRQKITYDLVIENISDERGNTAEVLQDTFVYDPKIASIHMAGNSTLQVEFKVPLVPSFANNPLNFAVDQGWGHPEAAVPHENTLTQLTLYFKKDFAPNTAYLLTVSNLKDTLGQWIPASTHLFGSGEKPGFNELLITEIMADPTPPLGLPEADYLEIYNPTEKIVSLQGVQLSDAVATTTLPDALLQPGEYAILCASGDADEFSSFGRAIGASNFPVLNSTEDDVSLHGEDGQLIFSITYQDDWYKDSQKAQGGWSLEMIEMASPCGEDGNWTASEDASGGTPGRENSVRTSNSDGMGPHLISAQAASPAEIQLTFNENLNPSGIFSGNYRLDPHIMIDSVQAGNDLSEVLLQLQESLQPKTPYTLEVENVSDCNGNLISATHHTFTFYLPEVSDSLDILLNEVLFAPRSGGEKFVELYNHSGKYINLKDWQLANLAGDSVNNFKPITLEDFVLAPGAFLVLTEDATILQADYPQTRTDRVLEVAALPSYPISEGAVLLVNDREEVVQIFEYTDDFHFPLLKDTKGVSLERISWEGGVNDPNNWHSAAASAGYATPGFMNSQYRQYEKIAAQFEVAPRVFLPDNSGRADFTSIRYQFDEPGHVATIRIFDAQGRKVKDLVQNATLSTEDAIQWDGTDNHHQKVKMGYYLIYIEVFHLNGERQVFKEKVAVAARF